MTRTIKSALLALFLLSVSSYGRTTRSANRRRGLSSNSRGTADSRDLHYVYETLDMVSSMSMPLETSKKGSKKGMKCKKEKSSKKHKKSKGKGKGMSSKGKSSKGKGNGKGKGNICDAPTPGPAQSMAPASAMAPTDSPRGSPTAPPDGTQAPTIIQPLPTLTPTMSPVTITLDLYALLYFVDAFRLPFQTEIDVVVALTQGYLEDFFTVVFESSSIAEFEGSMTVEDETIVRFGQPIQIRYFTDLTFSGTSQIPSDGELNGLLSSAFRGDNLAAYFAEIQALPESNIFAGSTSVEFSDVLAASSNSSSDSSSGVATVGIATAAGAGAFFVAVVGLMLYRRRDEDDEEDGKYLDNDGHITVAGETYQGGSSVDSQSGIHRTQQFGDAESSISPMEWGEEMPSRKVEEEHVSSPPMSFEDSASESDSSEDYSFVESGDQQDSPHLDDVTL